MEQEQRAHQKRRGRGVGRGFTLVELMIAIAIVAILSGVAYPSYTKYIVRSKRTAAAAFITAVASKQEQAMINARSYQSSLSALGMTTPSEVSSNYTISITLDAGPPPGYTITATPIGGQLANDTKCKNLTYTNTQVKGISGTATVAECWK